MTDIMKEAGLTHAGFYAHFDARDALLAQASDRAGAERVGIRLSPHGPHGAFNATGAYEGVDEQYLDLVGQLSEHGLLYVHMADASAMGAPPVPAKLKNELRAAFNGPFIPAGGFDKASAQQVLEGKQADLIAFGRACLANPGLVERLRDDQPLSAPDPSTFYTPDAEGCTDCPTLAAKP
ncbi:MAG TPA: hypothetical protein VF670_13720 [Duganella sp.]